MREKLSLPCSDCVCDSRRSGRFSFFLAAAWRFRLECNTQKKLPMLPRSTFSVGSHSEKKSKLNSGKTFPISRQQHGTRSMERQKEKKVNKINFFAIQFKNRLWWCWFWSFLMMIFPLVKIERGLWLREDSTNFSLSDSAATVQSR